MFSYDFQESGPEIRYEYTGDRNITMIQGLDQNISGTGGRLIEIEKGGVGTTNVTLIFGHTPGNYEINFRIEIYGE